MFFVSPAVNEHGKIAETDKSLIRSHCMRGKNKKEDSRRSRREAKKKAANKEKPEPEVTSSKTAKPTLSPTSAGTHRPVPWLETRKLFLREMDENYQADEALKLEEEIALNGSRQARWTAAQLAGYYSSSIPLTNMLPEPIQTAGSLSSSADQELLHRCKLYHASFSTRKCPNHVFTVAQFARMKNTTFPIERCIDFDSYKYDHTPWLATDDAFFHCSLFGQAALRDFVSRSTKSSNIANYHLQRTLSLLNQRLKDTNSYLMDSTIFIIMTLTFMSSVAGNEVAVEAHMQGLSQIIDLRGPEFLLFNPKLNFKLDNIDLRSCLESGRKPIFLIQPSWDSLYAGAYPVSDDRLLLESLSMVSDSRLIHVFNDLQHLTRLTYEGHRRDEWISVPTFQKALHNIQSRLVNMELLSVEPIAELLRLALISFITTNFRINERNLPYKFLSSTIYQTLDYLVDYELEDREDLKDIMRWMLIVINMSDVEVDEGRLRKKWTRYSLGEFLWPDIRDRLQRIMWLSAFHDEIGRRAYIGLTWKDTVAPLAL